MQETLFILPASRRGGPLTTALGLLYAGNRKKLTMKKIQEISEELETAIKRVKLGKAEGQEYITQKKTEKYASDSYSADLIKIQFYKSS